jgi:hypothetical protein
MDVLAADGELAGWAGTIRTEGGPKGNGAFNASNRMLAYGDQTGVGLGRAQGDPNIPEACTGAEGTQGLGTKGTNGDNRPHRG